MTLVCHPTCLGSMVRILTGRLILFVNRNFLDVEIEPGDLRPMKTPKVIEETFLRTMKQVREHHWKNRINDIVLCIIVSIDS